MLLLCPEYFPSSQTTNPIICSFQKDHHWIILQIIYLFIIIYSVQVQLDLVPCSAEQYLRKKV